MHCASLVARVQAEFHVLQAQRMGNPRASPAAQYAFDTAALGGAAGHLQYAHSC
jgi:hypothetical protein